MCLGEAPIVGAAVGADARKRLILEESAAEWVSANEGFGCDAPLIPDEHRRRNCLSRLPLAISPLLK